MLKKVYFTLDANFPYFGPKETLSDGEVMGYVELPESEWLQLHQYDWLQMEEGDIFRFFRNERGELDCVPLHFQLDELKELCLN